MKIIAKAGNENIAIVYVAEMSNNRRIEFVESIQPPIPREKKWVLIISSMYGCPVKCVFCDAGGNYKGKLTKEELFEQIDFLVKTRFSDRIIPVEKFKIQFARVGEPAYNENVIDVLEEFHSRYNAPGFMPSISTIAPTGCNRFFERMLEIKNNIYKENFQLQFSIHTTDQKLRSQLIPAPKADFGWIADYGNSFYQKGHRKITLNFALADEYPFEQEVLEQYFSPEVFLIKITPVNPTYNAVKNRLCSEGLFLHKREQQFEELKKVGYDVIVSIGELEENQIGSNCGQYLENFEQEKQSLIKSYTYNLENVY